MPSSRREAASSELLQTKHLGPYANVSGHRPEAKGVSPPPPRARRQRNSPDKQCPRPTEETRSGEERPAKHAFGPPHERTYGSVRRPQRASTVRATTVTSDRGHRRRHRQTRPDRRGLPDHRHRRIRGHRPHHHRRRHRIRRGLPRRRSAHGPR